MWQYSKITNCEKGDVFHKYSLDSNSIPLVSRTSLRVKPEGKLAYVPNQFRGDDLELDLNPAKLETAIRAGSHTYNVGLELFDSDVLDAASTFFKQRLASHLPKFEKPVPTTIEYGPDATGFRRETTILDIRNHARIVGPIRRDVYQIGKIGKNFDEIFATGYVLTATIQRGKMKKQTNESNHETPLSADERHFLLPHLVSILGTLPSDLVSPFRDKEYYSNSVVGWAHAKPK